MTRTRLGKVVGSVRRPLSELSALQTSFRFHLEHGGYATPPGRAACALAAARAEIEARARGWETRCEDDEHGWYAYGEHRPYYVAVLVKPAEHWNESDEILATLGGIDCTDSEQPEYWRTIAADLALEQLEEVKAA